MNNSNNNTKTHADFQDKYRRSSNFPGLTENEAEELKPTGSGKLVPKEDTSDE